MNIQALGLKSYQISVSSVLDRTCWFCRCPDMDSQLEVQVPVISKGLTHWHWWENDNSVGEFSCLWLCVHTPMLRKQPALGGWGEERSTQLQRPLSKSWAILAQPKVTHSNCILLIMCSQGIASESWKP